jgi:AAA15 family ATPase/GTPase
MVLEFAITNFRSIKNRQVLDFRTSTSTQKKELPENVTHFPQKQYAGNFIKTGIVYGANAAGKSNFLKAFQALEELVVNSDKLKLDKPIPAYDPFLLDPTSRLQPTTFEIEFVAKDKKRYWYELSIEKFRVVKEELCVYPENRISARKAILFSRTVETPLFFGEFYQGKKDFTLNENQLLLSQAGLNAIPTLSEPYRFFSKFLSNAPAHSAIFDERMLTYTENLLSNDLEHESFNKAINSLIRAADTGISRLFSQEIEGGQIKLPEEMGEKERQRIIDRYKRRIKTVHPVFENGIEVGEEIFDLSRESTGTMKLVGLATFVVEALRNGSVIIVDELDKNLHPLLTRMIIRLFQSTEFNSNNAQLIFSTHDISLIDKDLFRLDQIFIADKDMEGISSISRLSDFKGITKVKALQKWYTLGMFKGIPAINDYEIDILADQATL